MPNELNFTATPNGIIPFDEDSRLWLRGCKAGDLVKVSVKKPRNAKFFKKWWALIQVGFDWWIPSCQGDHNGKTVHKNFEKFRKDIVIQTGRYDVVADIRGNVRPEAHSISWAKMTPLEFEKLYSDTISVLLGILPSHISHEDLRNAESSVLEFI